MSGDLRVIVKESAQFALIRSRAIVLKGIPSMAGEVGKCGINLNADLFAIRRYLAKSHWESGD